MTMPSIASPGVQVIRREQAAHDGTILRKRVAAYCRVSTDKEEQQSSLETQMTSFRSLIASRGDWELADVYADEGLSGTKAANRVEFQRMIADCEAGKIDYIVTKSISRLARNTMECLQYVRKLKEIGVYVYFEKERLDTSNTSSEMLLSILAAVAQEESHSISENIKWGMRKRFQAGEPKWVATYGFRKDEEGKYVIDPEQARGVRRIFELCAAGCSMPEIGRRLAQEGIPAAAGGKWWPKSLATVLHNEKYAGDVMMQKSYIVDHLSHKKLKNDQTVVPSYYVRDHHEAIVDRKTFDLVQAILAMKDRHLGSVQYPYYGTLYCPFCGEKMIRYCLPTRGHEPAWTCGRKEGEDAGCPAYALREKYVDRALREAYRKLSVRQLEELLHQDSPDIVEAAKYVMERKKKHPCLLSVEFIFLNAAVERITFHGWDKAVISWKFGWTSEGSVHYERVSDHPDASIQQTGNGPMVGGKPLRCPDLVMRCVDRVKESSRAVRVEGTDAVHRPRIYSQRSVATVGREERRE